MGVFIKPCRGCPLRDGCDYRDELRKRASGIGARSIRFDCDRLAAEVRPGRRIVIKMPVLRDAGYTHDPCEIISHEDAVATIHSVRRDYSFAPVVSRAEMDRIGEAADAIADSWTPEQTEKFRFRKAMPHTRILRFLDEPDRPLCDLGNIKNPDGSCESRGGCACKDQAAMIAALNL